MTSTTPTSPTTISINPQPEKTTMNQPPEANTPTQCELLLQQAEAMVALEREQLTRTTATHRILKITVTDHAGTHDGGEVRVHSSRMCQNCAHYGPHDDDWVRDGGLEKFGSCLNMCGAADAEEEGDRFCPEHQVPFEWDANLHCPDRPALTLVKGGKSC